MFMFFERNVVKSQFLTNSTTFVTIAPRPPGRHLAVPGLCRKYILENQKYNIFGFWPLILSSHFVFQLGFGVTQPDTSQAFLLLLLNILFQFLAHPSLLDSAHIANADPQPLLILVFKKRLLCNRYKAYSILIM